MAVQTINSLARFHPEQLAGKCPPLTIEINRDLLLHNPENIDPVRDMVNQIVLALNEWE